MRKPNYSLGGSEAARGQVASLRPAPPPCGPAPTALGLQIYEDTGQTSPSQTAAGPSFVEGGGVLPRGANQNIPLVRTDKLISLDIT